MPASAPAPTPPWPGKVGARADAHHQPPPDPPGPPGRPARGRAGGRGNDVPGEQDRPHPLAVIGAIAWKAAIGGFALNIGLYNTWGERIEMRDLSWLTVSSNVAVGVVYLLLAVYPLLALGRRTEPRRGWLRGAMTVSMVFVMAVWLSGMGGFDDAHGLVPLLVLADWLFVGRNQRRTRFWEPLTWPVLLVGYLIYYKAEDLDHYPDVLGEDDTGFVVGGIAFVVALGYIIWGLAYLRIGIGASMRKDGSTSGPGWPDPGEPGGPGGPFPGVPPPAAFSPGLPGAQGHLPAPYPQAQPGPGFGPRPG